jgi:rubrerythrin
MKPAKERSDFSHTEEVLALATSAEMDAHQFYLRAADQTKDGRLEPPSSPWPEMRRGIACN